MSHDSTEQTFPPDPLSELRSQQQACWEQGNPLSVDSLLQDGAAPEDRENARLELLYNEFCVRERLGDEPTIDEYLRGYPELEGRLRRLFEVHEALEKDLGGLADWTGESASGSSRFWLLRITAPQVAESYPLDREGQIVGRSPTAAIFVDDPSVSRHHCGLWMEDGAVHLQDCGSMNGTYVNGRRAVYRRLEPGDRLRVGNTELELQRAADTQERATVESE